jgi:pectate lyase
MNTDLYTIQKQTDRKCKKYWQELNGMKYSSRQLVNWIMIILFLFIVGCEPHNSSKLVPSMVKGTMQPFDQNKSSQNENSLQNSSSREASAIPTKNAQPYESTNSAPLMNDSTLNSTVDPPSIPIITPQYLDQSKQHPSVLAFPGAEGFGAVSVGGRFGKVIEVTNLNDDGPGSLRAAIENSGPRIVVFRAAGTIELKSSLEIADPYITIAGQTAPGGGITLKNSPANADSPLVVKTHDVVIRYIRSRPGAPIEKSENGDAIEIHGPGGYNVIVDHCSFSWAIDEVASTWYDAHDVTIQWSIISEGLYCSQHVKGCHSMGLMVGSDGAKDISIHHNLLAHNHERNPLIQTSGLVDVVNNIIYNAWGTPILISDDHGKVTANLVGDYQIYGPSSELDKYLVGVSINHGIEPEIFVQGNISPQRQSDDQKQALVVKSDSRDWIVIDRFDAPEITTVSAPSAISLVLSYVGASIGLDDEGNAFWRQDQVDQRIINDVKNGTGKIIDDPSQVGGWPKLDSGNPSTDTDHDGMPDAWEQIYGFNPSDPSDSSQDADQDGYTNVEEFLNVTNPLK